MRRDNPVAQRLETLQATVPASRPIKAAVLATAASALGFGVVVIAAMDPRDPSSAAAVFPPWWTRTHAIEAAASAGDVIAPGGFANIVLVHGDPATLKARLRAAGAVLLLDPLAARLCGAA